MLCLSLKARANQRPTGPKVRINYRLISCYNVIYKDISKIIVNRLSKVLIELVDDAQARFVKGKSMADSILMVQELI